MGYAVWHWRAYNVLRRLTGLAFCVGGTIGLLSPILQRFGWADGPPMSRSEMVVGAVVWFVAIAIGLILCRRPPFRPDLGDFLWLDYFTPGRVKPTVEERRARSWWTGNPTPARDAPRL